MSAPLMLAPNVVPFRARRRVVLGVIDTKLDIVRGVSHGISLAKKPSCITLQIMQNGCCISVGFQVML